MRRMIDHNSMGAIGFVEPWSVKAGDDAGVFISSCDPAARASIVELDRDHPRIVDWPLARRKPSFEARAFDLGSWLELPVPSFDRQLTLDLEILLTRNRNVKPVLSWEGFALTVGPDGQLQANGYPFARTRNEEWYRLTVVVEPQRTSVLLTPIDGAAPHRLDLDSTSTPQIIFIGAEPTHIQSTLNARIGRIALSCDRQRLEWRFPNRGLPKTLPPTDASSPLLTIRNGPTLAVASPRFTGEIHDPRLAPDHFDALHLHDDDFDGFDWDADLIISVPHGARSGVYALHLETSKGTEAFTFFVRPAKPVSSIGFLVPTATYLAYADEQLPPDRYPWHGTDRTHRFAIENNFLSLYDIHSDGSGVSLASSRRPRATLRSDYHYPLSNSPHLLSVDLELLKFAARRGIDVELVTDHDLDAEGQAALAPYALLLTGSHPEYWSSRMMRGLKGFLGSGGSLAYLGGNGFYWVVALQDDKMELRRGKNEIWTGRPGEMHLALTGEPGGNWEDRGRHHPQALVGVTYVIMSFGPSRPYRRLEESYEGEFAWLFDGVSATEFGHSGRVLGGAAGYEIDAILDLEETPSNLVRLAVADGFDHSFQVRSDLWLAGGEREHAALRRADMTAYRHAGGGIVLSMSSVAWIGALPLPGEENDVGQIMENLLRKFE